MDRELTPFNPDLEFFVEFQLNWSLPRDGDMRWEPSIEVTDRGGQGPGFPCLNCVGDTRPTSPSTPVT